MTRPMVILNGGFGNQMFQLAKAIDISFEGEVALNCAIGKTRDRSDSKPYILDYQLPNNVFLDYSELHPLVKKCIFFAMRLRLKNYKSVTSVQIVNLIIDKFLKFVSLIQPTISNLNIPSDIGYFEDFSEVEQSILLGYFQTYKWKNYGYVKRTLYSLKNNDTRGLIDYYQKKSNLENPLVVHIRLGDYRKEPKFGILGPKYFAEAISFAYENAAFSSIWLFSDEPEEALKMLPKEFLEKVQVIPEVGQSPTLTYEVMRLGYGYVLSNSTFGWWAAFLSKCSPSIVIVPEPWFIGINEPNKLIPASWVKIGRQ